MNEMKLMLKIGSQKGYWDWKYIKMVLNQSIY